MSRVYSKKRKVKAPKRVPAESKHGKGGELIELIEVVFRKSIEKKKFKASEVSVWKKKKLEKSS